VVYGMLLLGDDTSQLLCWLSCIVVYPLCSTHKNVVNRNVDQLHEVTNESHHCKANSNSLGDLNEFFLGGLGTPSEELVAVTEELLGNFSEFFDLVGHS